MQNLNHDWLKQHGVFLPQAVGLLEDADYNLAMDAQSPLITVNNAGIPSFLTTVVDPRLITVLTTPSKAAQIAVEQKQGDWTTKTAVFKMAELTGEVTSYGDFSESGSANANYQFVNRQSYLFQTVTQWGALELDTASQAQLNYAADLNTSSALVLSKYLNKTYFFGVSGLANYGLLNDPSLTAPIAPATKVAGGVTWAVATADEIYKDVQLLFAQLVLQTKGIVERDAPMVLALSPEMEASLIKTNVYGLNVLELIKTSFQNIKIVSAVQYATVGGQLAQLIATSIDGVDTVNVAYNEKMRAHAVIPTVSGWKQKKTSGTWGAIIRYPVAIAGMLGM